MGPDRVKLPDGKTRRTAPAPFKEISPDQELLPVEDPNSGSSAPEAFSVTAYLGDVGRARRDVSAQGQNARGGGSRAAIQRQQSNSIGVSVQVQGATGIDRNWNVVRNLVIENQLDERAGQTIADDQRARESG